MSGRQPKTRYSRIAGTGSAHPQRRVTNDQLVREMRFDKCPAPIDADWIRTRTGILERRLSETGHERDTTSSLAAAAAIRALEMAGRSAESIDQLIVATCTPEHLIPSTACLVQEKIGASRAWAFDVNAACAGFVYALALADQAIRSGSARCVLIVGSDVLSAYTDWRDPSSAVLFGDGAGAMVLEGELGDGTQGVLTAQMGSGGGTDLFRIEAGGSACAVTPEVSAQGGDKMRMKGREIFKASVRTMTDYARLAAETCGVEMSQIHWFVPHQANLRILEAVAERIPFPPERTLVNVDRFGNTSAATIPTALDEGLRDGRVKPGQLVLMVGFGAGLTYGSALARM